MTIDFIGALEERGFVIMPMGGNCQALVLDCGPFHIVLTGGDGAYLPFDGDWMACRYDHFLTDPVEYPVRCETAEDGRDIGEAIADMLMDSTASNYIAAYRAVHGDAPSIEQHGTRYHVTTRSGSFAYSRAEVEALTRGLLHLANRSH